MLITVSGLLRTNAQGAGRSFPLDCLPRIARFVVPFPPRGDAREKVWIKPHGPH